MNTGMVEWYQQYKQANYYLNEGLIRTGPLPDPGKKRRRNSWMPAYLDALGNPQRGIPAIHVAGTSGKGTTALMIARMLYYSGYRCGLHVSPYIQSATEKIWIDGENISAENFVQLINRMKPVTEQFRSPYTPLHGMASVALALLAFKQAKVDCFVFEAGVGGRFDLSNFLDTSLAVITKIGLDHQKTLGNTCSEIAWHKAGIMRKDVPCVALRGNGMQTIKKEADRIGAPLYFVKPSTHFQVREINTGGARFNYFGSTLNLHNLTLEALGDYQVENAALAIAAAEQLIKQGFTITETAIRESLRAPFLPGRMEIVQRNPLVILDGAHNPDKLENLLKFVSRETEPQKTCVVCGVLAKKVKWRVISRLTSLGARIITTEPRVYQKQACDAEKLANRFRRRSLNTVEVEPDAHQAIQKAITDPAHKTILVTGSLYLIGNVRGLWYPDEEVVLQCTSYPQV